MTNSKIMVLFLIMGSSAPVFAYIDPASGSAIMSAVVGFFVASAMFFKTYWYKFKSMFTKRDSEEAAKDEDA